MRTEHGGVASQDPLGLGGESGVTEDFGAVHVRRRHGHRRDPHQLAPRGLHVAQGADQIAPEQVDVAEVVLHLGFFDRQARLGVSAASELGILRRLVETEILHAHETARHVHAQCHECRLLDRRDRLRQPVLRLAEAPGHLRDSPELAVEHCPRLTRDARQRQRVVTDLLSGRRLAGARHHIGQRAHGAGAQIDVIGTVDRRSQPAPGLGIPAVVDEIDRATVQVPRRTRHDPIMANRPGQRGRTSGSESSTACTAL